MTTKRNHERVYRTAAELEITEAEKRVLLLAQKWLAKALPARLYPIPADGLFEFFMGITRRPTVGQHVKGLGECGSQGCIWGLCHVIAKARKINAFVEDPAGLNHVAVASHGVSEALDNLFFPHRSNSELWPVGSYSTVTPLIAAAAVQHFLKTGEVRFRT